MVFNMGQRGSLRSLICGDYFSNHKNVFKLQVANSVASKVIDWMGGVGFVKSNPVEKFYRDAKIGKILRYKLEWVVAVTVP